MAEWRGFNASNEPGTCIWCGNKLRYRVLDAHYEEIEVPLEPDHPLRDAGYTTRKKHKSVTDRRAELSGDYQDGVFCGLRCGYQFGVRMAEFGRRIKPFEDRS